MWSTVANTDAENTANYFLFVESLDHFITAPLHRYVILYENIELNL